MSEGYKIGRLRGDFVIVFRDSAGKRHRYSLGTADASEAKRLAPTIYAELTRPRGTSVADLWRASFKTELGVLSSQPCPRHGRHSKIVSVQWQPAPSRSKTVAPTLPIADRKSVV